jgi:hypothetical protein
VQPILRLTLHVLDSSAEHGSGSTADAGGAKGGACWVQGFTARLFVVQAANEVGYGGKSHQDILASTKVPAGRYSHFVELHIEQGTGLLRMADRSGTAASPPAHWVHPITLAAAAAAAAAASHSVWSGENSSLGACWRQADRWPRCQPVQRACSAWCCSERCQQGGLSLPRGAALVVAAAPRCTGLAALGARQASSMPTLLSAGASLFTRASNVAASPSVGSVLLPSRGGWSC